MNPLRHARRLGIERGLLGSSRFWLAVGVLERGLMGRRLPMGIPEAALAAAGD